jgi:hypothetical protein
VLRVHGGRVPFIEGQAAETAWPRSPDRSIGSEG